MHGGADKSDSLMAPLASRVIVGPFTAMDIAKGTVITDIKKRHSRRVHRILDQRTTGTSPPTWMCTSSWNRDGEATTPGPWRLVGSQLVHIFISRQHTGHGWNIVEWWFSALTTKNLQRSAHRSAKNYPRAYANGSRYGTRTPPRSCGTRPRKNFSNASPAAAPPSNRHRRARALNTLLPRGVNRTGHKASSHRLKTEPRAINILIYGHQATRMTYVQGYRIT
jgi:hypothetical protein